MLEEKACQDLCFAQKECLAWLYGPKSWMCSLFNDTCQQAKETRVRVLGLGQKGCEQSPSINGSSKSNLKLH